MSSTNGTYLAFDYGSHRIGVAVGESSLEIARPLEVVSNSSGTPDWKTIDQLLEQWQPSGLVVGWPLTLSGEEQAIKHARGYRQTGCSRHTRVLV